ncbi:MAG: hypothetical protein ACW986_19425 [Promethearchaeota archaeon]
MHYHCGVVIYLHRDDPRRHQGHHHPSTFHGSTYGFNFHRFLCTGDHLFLWDIVWNPNEIRSRVCLAFTICGKPSKQYSYAGDSPNLSIGRIAIRSFASF